MILLGIETSCDETSVCFLKDGSDILTLLTASQNQFHARFGGVVPEIASRQHSEALLPLLHEALSQAKLALKDIDGVAVTCGPGLEGALLMGVSFAKALAFSLNIPLIGVNHIEGHIYSNFLHGQSAAGTTLHPYLALIASGGHSEIIHVVCHGKYVIVGETVDDAAGECLDKIARKLGIGFPGGAAIEQFASKGDPCAIPFPRAAPKGKPLHFSFSGLKTAVLRWIEQHENSFADQRKPAQLLYDLCASFQEAIVDALTQKTIQASLQLGLKTIVAGGGVIVNKRLREKLLNAGAAHGIQIHFPDPRFCADNAAMIACAGYYRWKQRPPCSSLQLSVEPRMRIDNT